MMPDRPDRALEEAEKALLKRWTLYGTPGDQAGVQEAVALVISTYLGALRRELPPKAVLAAAQVGYSERAWRNLGTERRGEKCTVAELVIRGFLVALTGEGPDG